MIARLMFSARSMSSITTGSGTTITTTTIEDHERDGGGGEATVLHQAAFPVRHSTANTSATAW